MSGRRVARAAAVGIAAALLLTAWYFLAPSQLGGRTAYVTTVGSSMEPLLEPGDLVVVRRSSSYQVGDVVAFRSQQLDAVVLHRIVDLDGDRFVLQGDNNGWTDSYRPSHAEVVGEMVARLPGVGVRLGAVRSPLGASSLAAAGAIGVLGRRRRVRRHRAHRDEERRTPAAARADLREVRRPRRRDGAGRRVGTAVSAVVATIGAVLCAVSFLIPPTRQVTEDIVYVQRGTFTYEARVPGGEGVYGTDTVGTGDPVYLQLTDRMRVAFAYGFESRAATELAGTVALGAEVSDVNGWSRAFDLAPPMPFHGTEVALGGVLDLEALGELTAELERATGVDRLAYSVSVTAKVEVEGTLAGREVAETFEPRMAFLLDDLQLQLAPDASAIPDEGSSDPLEPATGGLLEVPRMAPRTFAVLGVELRLEPLRPVGFGLLGLGIVGLLMALARRLRAGRGGEPELIEARFGHWLVPVHTNGGYTADRVVEVESFESLLRLADHYGHMVLHDGREDEHVYVMEEGGVTYRYRSRTTARPGRR